MKNIVVSSLPTKDLVGIFLGGFAGAVLAGVLFGFLGLVLASYLGFSVTYGSEQFAMEGSMVFYGVLAASIGLLVGTYGAAIAMEYTPRFLYIFFASSPVIAAGLLGREYFNLYTLLVFGAVGSLWLTIAASYLISKSSSNLTEENK